MYRCSPNICKRSLCSDRTEDSSWNSEQARMKTSQDGLETHNKHPRFGHQPNGLGSQNDTHSQLISILG